MSFDLTVQYGPLSLKSPIVAGACALSAQELFRIGLVSAGVGAIVLPCIFEEEFCRVSKNSSSAMTSGEGLASDFSGNRSQSIKEISKGCLYRQPEDYLNLVRMATDNSPIPIIASLNGTCREDWSEFAVETERAGASAIEIQFHFPFHLTLSPDVEPELISITSSIKSAISIPLFLSLDRNYSYPCHLARQLADHVDGVVLFGHSPSLDIDLDTLTLYTTWQGPHSRPVSENLAAIRLLRQICPLLSVAANGGIESSEDLIKVLLMGADVATVTSAIHLRGATAVGMLREGLIRFMESRHLTSLKELRSLIPPISDPALNRARYIEDVNREWDSGNRSCYRDQLPFLPYFADITALAKLPK